MTYKVQAFQRGRDRTETILEVPTKKEAMIRVSILKSNPAHDLVEAWKENECWHCGWQVGWERCGNITEEDKKRDACGCIGNGTPVHNGWHKTTFKEK